MANDESLISWVLSANKRVTKRFLFLIVLVFCLTWAIAVPVSVYLGVEWFPVVNAAGSVSLTAVLALLYFHQSQILESQQELLTAELNRDLRENHTETLRERVREWHGNTEIDISDIDPLDTPSDNLPSVGQASFQSVDENGLYAFSETEFTAIPSRLKQDYYFQDLLQNHAPELQKQADAIEFIESDFQQVKSKFINDLNHIETKETEQYSLEPTDELSEWIFEELVKVKRYSDPTFDETRERMLDQIGSPREWEDGEVIWIHRDAGSGSFAVYGAQFSSVEDFLPREEQDQIVEEVEELIRSVLTKIEYDRPLERIDRAAELLNKGEKSITDLRYTLIEYDGRVVYPGDCEYLREESIVPRIESSNGPN